MNTTTTAPAAAPAFIEKADYAGPWTHDGVIRGMIAGRATADTIAKAIGATGVLWESAGTPRGSQKELFCRTRFVADAEGNLHCYASDGHKVIIHPAGRTLRILTMPVQS